jgi:hypothetical protein
MPGAASRSRLRTEPDGLAARALHHSGLDTREVMNMPTIKVWARRAVLPLGVLLFVDLCLDWHRASVSVGGALQVHADVSALAGWGLLAAVAVAGLIVWEGLRSTGTAPADQTGAEGLSTSLALSALAFTAIEFLGDSASVDVAGMVNVSAQERLWPAYTGLALAVLLVLAALVQLAPPVRTHARGRRLRGRSPWQPRWTNPPGAGSSRR